MSGNFSIYPFGHQSERLRQAYDARVYGDAFPQAKNVGGDGMQDARGSFFPFPDDAQTLLTSVICQAPGLSRQAAAPEQNTLCDCAESRSVREWNLLVCLS